MLILDHAQMQYMNGNGVDLFLYCHLLGVSVSEPPIDNTNGTNGCTHN